MPLMMYQSTFDALRYDLDAEIAAYEEALTEHAKTIGEPAPTTPALVEQIVKEYDGEYEVIPDPTAPDELPAGKPADSGPTAMARLERLEQQMADIQAMLKK